MLGQGSPVIYEVTDQVGWVTINRPEVMNALNQAVRDGLTDAFEQAGTDNQVLVVILTGAGGRAFSAGADLKQRVQGGAATERRSGDVAALPSGYLVEQFPKPVIAAIDGYCLAGGFEQALACDIRIGTERSVFGLPEPRRSLLADYGLHNLNRMIPLGEALWIQLTGGHMSARRAYEMGLIQAILPDRDALFAEADRLASEIKLCAPLAVQAIKRITRTGREMSIGHARKFAEPIQAYINSTEDHAEGPRAFVEKRLPNWKMR